MDLREMIEIEAPPDAVWPLLRDPQAIAECFPGAELRGNEGDSYDGRITVRFGPTSVSFQGRAQIVPDDDQRVMTITARGRDSRGATRASAEVVATVHAEGTDRTRVELTGDVDVVGPLAQFARTGGVAVTRQLLRDFGTCVAARATVAAPAEATSIVPSAGHRAPVEGMVWTRTAASAPPNMVSILWRALRDWIRERLVPRPKQGGAR